jgi:hypothetical protein
MTDNLQPTPSPDANRAADMPSENGFPVRSGLIAARDLAPLEPIGGKSYGQAALRGASAGALFGVLVGFVSGIFNVAAPAASAIALGSGGLVLGVLAGAFAGVFAHWARADRRRSRSAEKMQAGPHAAVTDEVQADAGTAELRRAG